MTDTVKSWIEETRTLTATGKSQGEYTVAAVTSLRRLPRALDALNKVLELHASDMLYENVGRCENYNEYHVDDFHTESEDGVEICMGMPTGTRVCRSCRVADEPVDWPCETIQAIEGAIND